MDERPETNPPKDQPNVNTDGGEPITGGTSAVPGTATLNGAGTGPGGLLGEYQERPENTASHIYDKDKRQDPPTLHEGGERREE